MRKERHTGLLVVKGRGKGKWRHYFFFVESVHKSSMALHCRLCGGKRWVHRCVMNKRWPYIFFKISNKSIFSLFHVFNLSLKDVLRIEIWTVSESNLLLASVVLISNTPMLTAVHNITVCILLWLFRYSYESYEVYYELGRSCTILQFCCHVGSLIYRDNAQWNWNFKPDPGPLVAP